MVALLLLASIVGDNLSFLGTGAVGILMGADWAVTGFSDFFMVIGLRFVVLGWAFLVYFLVYFLTTFFAVVMPVKFSLHL